MPLISILMATCTYITLGAIVLNVDLKWCGIDDESDCYDTDNDDGLTTSVLLLWSGLRTLSEVTLHGLK